MNLPYCAAEFYGRIFLSGEQYTLQVRVRSHLAQLHFADVEL
jgi:hypothetical protein